AYQLLRIQGAHCGAHCSWVVGIYLISQHKQPCTPDGSGGAQDRAKVASGAHGLEREPAQLITGRELLKPLPPLPHDRADALGVVDGGELMQHWWAHIEDGYAQLALLADEALRGWGGEQPTTDHERVERGSVLHRMEDEAETLDIVEAAAIATCALPEGSDSLDERVVEIGEERAVPWEGAVVVVASAPGLRRVYGCSD